jgi:hypothetical protein
MREKALADEADKRRCHETAAQEETAKNSAVQMTSALWRRYNRPTLVTRKSGAFG